MAAEQVEDNYINLVDMKFIDNILYFIPENDGNLESDHFSNVGLPKFAIIRNLNDQVLLIDQGEKPVFEDMTDSDIKVNSPQTKFIIKTYKDSKLHAGLAVTISVRCMGKTFTLSCENKTVNFKAIHPPETIMETKSDLIFFMRIVVGHEKKQFESSSYPGHFLACEKDADCYKLILKELTQIGDKSVIFTVDPPEELDRSP